MSRLSSEEHAAPLVGAIETQFHASCVAFHGKGLLILGASGAGKSALALRLMALGAALVADDRVDVRRDGQRVIASCPAALSGLIEARSIGILRAVPVAQADIALVADLGRSETERLPPRRHVSVLGIDVDLVLGVNSDHFPAALLCYLSNGRQS